MARYPDALECDLAQYYQIHDLHGYSVAHVATLACGLPSDSRVIRLINEQKYPVNTLLLASAVDRLGLLWWSKTEDGQNNINRPKRFIDVLMGIEDNSKDLLTFKSGADFKKAWDNID